MAFGKRSQQAAPPPPPPPSPTKKPVFDVLLGHVKLSVWENDGQYSKMYAATIEKVYKDQTTKEWKYTRSIDLKDFLAAARAFQMAYDTVVAEMKQGVRISNNDPNAPPGDDVPQGGSDGDIPF